MKLRIKIYKWFAFTVFLSLLLTLLTGTVDGGLDIAGSVIRTLMVVIPVLLFLEYGVFLRILRIYKYTEGTPGITSPKIRDYGHDEITDIIEYLNKQSTDIKYKHEQITELKDQLRFLVDDAPILVQRFTKDGLIKFINNTYAEHFGITEKYDLLGVNIFDFFAQRGYDFDLKKDLARLTMKRPVMSNVYKRRSTDGWLLWVSRAIFDEYGNTKEYQMIGIDITQQKEIERKLEILTETISTITLWVNVDETVEYVSKGIDEICAECSAAKTLSEILSGISTHNIESLSEDIYNALERRVYSSREVRLYNLHKKRFVWYRVDAKPVESSRVLITINDINDLVLSRSLIEKGAEMRNFTYEMISNLTSVDLVDIRPVIDKSIERLGRFLGADKVAISLFDEGQVRVANQWTSPVFPDSLRRIPVKTTEWWKDVFSRHPEDFIIVNDFTDLDDEEVKTIASSQGITSAIIAPIAFNHTHVGTIIASAIKNDADWGELDATTVRMVGRLIGTVIRPSVEKEGDHFKINKMII